MQAFLSLAMGYFMGCISPAAWVGKRHNVNLKEEGTGNLGATNTALVLGKAAGIFVMVFDMAKSFFSYKLAKYLFPQLVIAGLLACIGVILGHCFPIFLHFQGGKGLAAFGGMILAYSWKVFLTILIPGLILMAILDTGVAMPMLAGVLFPIIVYRRSTSAALALTAAAASSIILFVHRDNLKRALEGNDVVGVRDFFRKVLPRK
ncbi:MAG: glycerol-3-phosphate acyltransferase [Oscillospiraceae bacterium]|nr:glycerol-3-phosphate acyltransferase [Oscillospiraceae bacterium]